MSQPTVEPRATTPTFAWRVPVLGNVPNVPSDLTNLALDIEATMKAKRAWQYRLTSDASVAQSVAGTAATLTVPVVSGRTYGAWGTAVFDTTTATGNVSVYLNGPTNQQAVTVAGVVGQPRPSSLSGYLAAASTGNVVFTLQTLGLAHWLRSGCHLIVIEL